jgi:hypothetical protein
MRKLMVIMALTLALCGAMAMSAQATTLFEFDTSGGSLFYNGGATPLVGFNIGVTSVTVSGAPLNNGTYAVTSGLLTFNTGNLTGSDADEWFFGAGGAISYQGVIEDVPGFGDTATQFAGQFTSALVRVVGDNSYEVVAEYNDEKCPDLLALFGLTETSWSGSLNLPFVNANALPPSSFTSTGVEPGTFTNVPVPPAVWLFGSGLLGLVGLRRKLKA